MKKHMILFIDTTVANQIRLQLKQAGQLIAELNIDTNRNQNELLLPEIEKLLKQNKLKLSNLTSIEVANGQGSFSSLRLGIVTANALGYALGIPVKDDSGFAQKTEGLTIIDPIYNGEPNIGGK
jgi:tRNA threonylcarbamoyl adenosine modification protein YeaZ